MEETERIEEYLETMCRLEENKQKLTTSNIARELKISPSSVTEMLQKLNLKGYISYQQYRELKLTEFGRGLGYKILRKHRLVEEFLRLLDVSEAELHKEACELEHKLSDGVEQSLRGYLDSKREELNLARLSELLPGEAGVVMTVEGDSRLVTQLSEMGISRKELVMVVKSTAFHGPLLIRVNNRNVPIGRSIANKVLIRKK